MDDRTPRPVSTRHAFALAFELAFRRDPVHSLLVPFLLIAPWAVALIVLPDADAGPSAATLLVRSAATAGGFLAWLLVTAMLRFRARSVFNQPPEVPAAPALDCYTAGMRRVGWLFVTEFARSIILSLGFGALFAPGVYLGYRLAFATEAVVLTEPGTAAAFRHSFRLARRRFERWLEMMVVSVLIGIGVTFLGTALTLAFSLEVAFRVVGVLLLLVWPVFQYAWTFYYLRLIEVEEPEWIEAGPAYAAGPPGVGTATGSGITPGMPVTGIPGA